MDSRNYDWLHWTRQQEALEVARDNTLAVLFIVLVLVWGMV